MGDGDSPGGELPGDLASPPLDFDAFGLVVEQDGTTLYLRLAGEFDRTCVGRVEAALAGAASLTRRVIFDLRELSFLDLAGLRTILSADERSYALPFDVLVVRPARVREPHLYAHARRQTAGAR